MKPVQTLLLRGIFLALLVLSLTSSVARADDSWLTPGAGDTIGDTIQGANLFPEDPGFE